jgi:hypothetical protein
LDGGFGIPLPPDECKSLCGQLQFPPSPVSCSVRELSSTTIRVQCQITCLGVGRRPPGLEEKSASGEDLASYFSAMAELEAASVDAFRILRRELTGHRLPKKLDRAMRRAARDEVRHARAARALGRRFGATYTPPTMKSEPRRTLREIAIDNAVEGCVRETFGALVATYQSKMAKDLHVRATMARIARDETRHAALSWQLDGWLAARLPRDEREQVAEAKRAAHANLVDSLGQDPTTELAETAGLPPTERARQLLDHLARSLGFA